MKQFLFIFLVFLPICAYSQLKETFDGPEITSANPWTGDLSRFAIEDGWLVSRADPDESSAYIEIPITYTDDMRWDFEVNMNLKPTNFNHIKIYLYSDPSESGGAATDYYLQIGSNDNTLTLRKKTGDRDPVTLRTKVLDALSEEGARLRLRVTLAGRKTWSIYVKESGGYRLLGDYDATLSPSTSGGYLRLECRYSKTHVNDFAFDFIEVSDELQGTEEPDVPDIPEEATDPPQLVGIRLLSESTLQLRYDRPVYIFDATFSIEAIGETSRIAYADDTRTRVNIYFDEALEAGEEYLLSCAGLKDERGDEMPEMSYTFWIEDDSEEEEEEEEPDEPEKPDEEPEPEQPESVAYPPGCVRINEVMANPKEQTAFPETEYVELHNRSDEAIDLTGWLFLYGDKSIALAEMEMEADGYVVLYRAGREIHVDASGVAMPLEKFPAALANTGKELALLDPSGKEIDRVAYGEAEPGIAWERSEEGFYLSGDPRGGTPGSANSERIEAPDEDEETEEEGPEPEEPARTVALPSEIVFNELLPNPYPDGSEYIELYNRSDRALPLSGLSIATRKTDGSLSARYPLSSIPAELEPGGFALLTKDIEGVTAFYWIPDPYALREVKLPVLANTSATLVLFRSDDEVVIDEVSYSSQWHAPSIKEEKGVALERIDPDGDSREASNWTSASSLEGYGTPGYRNSQYGKPVEERPTGIEAPVYSEQTEEYTIDYHVDRPGYTCRAWIFDTAGRLIREVVSHESLGLEGSLRWDGLSGSGSRVKTGIYIFYAELLHPDGEARRYKKVFLVK